MFKHKKTELILTPEEVEKFPYFSAFISTKTQKLATAKRGYKEFEDSPAVKNGEVKSVSKLLNHNELPMQFIIKQGGMNKVVGKEFYLVEFFSQKTRDTLAVRNFPATGLSAK